MTVLPLQGLHVWITRPLTQAQRWQQQLTDLGAQTQLVPVLDIAPISAAAHLQKIAAISARLNQFDKIIFISQNAVTHGRQHLHQLPASAALFAIGSTTAAALTDWGYAAATVDAAMNSENLLQHADLQGVNQQKILICRGVGGRTELAASLQQRGARVETCELYQRIPHPEALKRWQQALVAPGIPSQHRVVSAHSGESLQLLADLLHRLNSDQQQDSAGLGTLRRGPLLVPGQRVEALARQLGFTQVLRAENASDTVMTETLQRWWQRQ